MNETVAVIDFETTGLSPEWGARATEVAAVVIENGRPAARYESLMNAGVRIPPDIVRLTGITNRMVRGAPRAAEVMEQLARFVGKTPLIAHNAPFDRKFLDAELQRIHRTRQQDMICSVRVARRVYPDAPNHKLATLVAYTGIQVDGRHHRAMVDAEMTVQLWLRMVERLRGEHGLRQVPLDLMSRLQPIPGHSLATFLARYRERTKPRAGG